MKKQKKFSKVKTELNTGPCFVAANFRQITNVLKAAAGFTLIELLVVIAIIALLASVVLVSLNSARQKSRDAKRVADMNQMAKALELFYNDASAYPTGTGSIGGATSYVVTGGAVLGSVLMQSYLRNTSATLNMTPTYVTGLPSAPIPPDNTSGGAACNVSTNKYMYEAGANGSTYTLTFCVGGKNVVGQLPGGIHYLTPGGFK